MQSPYRELSQNSFRLLTLHPGDDEVDVLEATLSTHQLSESPPYDAISYTWDEPGDEGLVYLNGVPHEVRSNLWDFLQILRSPSHSVCIWVDALCIKQNDPIEKGHQVQSIGRIFRNARRVSVWLGNSGMKTDDLFYKAETLRAGLDYRSAQGVHETQQIYDCFGYEDHEPDGLKAVLFDLLRRPYWTRCWIVQECLLNPVVVVHCGRCHISWEQLIGFVDFIRNIYALRHVPGFTTDCSEALGKLDFMKGLRLRSVWQIGLDMDDLYSGQTLLHCADRRDVIYAFMEILQEARLDLSARLTVDYTVSLSELYFRACYAFFSTLQPSIPADHHFPSIIYGLRRQLMLTEEDIEAAIRMTVDPTDLFLPLRYFLDSFNQKESRHLNLLPNPHDPERRYNIYELYAADFEKLTTGELADGGARVQHPYWWPSALRSAHTKNTDQYILDFIWAGERRMATDSTSNLNET